MKKTIVFLETEFTTVVDHIDTLQQEGYDVLEYRTAKELISQISNNHIHADLIITEHLLSGVGDENSFGGKRKSFFDDCAILLADELKRIDFKGKLIVLTSWYDAKIIKQLQDSEKFDSVLAKLLTGPDELLDIVNKVLFE
ncbi:MAG: hypothetical protein WC606_00545 [Candidatus Absconditabacterales bacterium]|jgi:hypothetical protein